MSKPKILSTCPRCGLSDAVAGPAAKVCLECTTTDSAFAMLAVLYRLISVADLICMSNNSDRSKCDCVSCRVVNAAREVVDQAEGNKK